MKLWLLTPLEGGNYSFDMSYGYTSVIVAAETIKEAKSIHPKSEIFGEKNEHWNSSEWACSPKRVKAKLIGKAVKGIKSGVVLSSYFGT